MDQEAHYDASKSLDSTPSEVNPGGMDSFIEDGYDENVSTPSPLVLVKQQDFQHCVLINKSRPNFPVPSAGSIDKDAAVQPLDERMSNLHKISLSIGVHHSPVVLPMTHPSTGKGAAPDVVKHEHDFEVEDNKFAFTPGQLAKLLNPKSLAAFQALGGLGGLTQGLRTNKTSTDVKRPSFDSSTAVPEFGGPVPIKKVSSLLGGGTSTGTDAVKHGGSFVPLERDFGLHRLPNPHTPSFWQLVHKAYSEKFLLYWVIACVLQVAILLYFTGSGKNKDIARLWSVGGVPLLGMAVHTLWFASGEWLEKKKLIALDRGSAPAKSSNDDTALSLAPAEVLLAQSQPVSSKALATSLHRRARSVPLRRLLPFLLVTPSYAYPVADAQTGHEQDWQQRARGALTNNLVTFAFLLWPTIVLAILGFLANHFHSNAQEGYAFFGMLGTGVVFVAISKPADADVSENDYYMRIAVGIAYVLFMAVFCRLIAIRQRWYKGRCAIAGGAAIVLTLVGMAIPQIRSCWLQTAKLDPLIAVLVGTPISFALCDLVVYVVRKFGGSSSGSGHTDGIELGRRGGHEGPEQPTLPLPVPGPTTM